MPRDSVFAAAARQAEELIERKLRERAKIVKILGGIDEELGKLRAVIDLAKNGVKPSGLRRKTRAKKGSAPPTASTAGAFDPLKHQIHLPGEVYLAVEKVLQEATAPMAVREIAAEIKRQTGTDYAARTITLQLSRGKDLHKFKCEGGRGPKAAWLAIKGVGRVVTQE